MSSSGPFLYPNVSGLPGQTGIRPETTKPEKPKTAPGEFDRVLEGELGQVKAPLKFSAHASQRLQDRKIALDAATMSKLGEAIDRAEAKGIEDTLVLTKDAALIVSVKNRTVVTALDRNSLSGNVFTNIDGAVVL